MGPAATPAAPTTSDRLVSLDAYRGFVMLAMVSSGLGLAGLLKLPEAERAQLAAPLLTVADQFEHREWEGCTFWDLIQPSFMFIVGAAMPFSFARRAAAGQPWSGQFAHAVRRALLLILIGIFLDSYASSAPHHLVVQMIRVLQQIAIGYVVAFFTLRGGPILQGSVMALLLVGHTFLYLQFAGDPNDPWNRATNFGINLDRSIHEAVQGAAHGVFQFLFGRNTSIEWFPVSRGDYAVVNALSSAATIVAGVLAGELLRTRWEWATKVTILTLAGLICLAVGAGLAKVDFPYVAETRYRLGLELTLPMVKRIWTASFGLYALGWTSLLLALFYAVFDGCNRQTWAFPFVVVGMNSIAIYVVAGVFRTNILRAVQALVGDPLKSFGYLAPFAESVLAVGVLWLFCYWLYRQRIFFKV